ncbi:MAG TPA: hydroxymethylbilane synthase [Chloroflexota bacterium]|jgi:hydroxymethylbilane synthase|nr:hydroxymethylbilane synthase [Chloroflexota bacterium]
MLRRSTPVRIGTRGSDLALAQTRAVITRLQAGFPALRCQEVVLSTHGDRAAEAPFSAVGSRGIFARDIEDAIRDGSVDLAVHSLKDLESDLPDGLMIGAMLPRADARDALAAAGGYTLATLPKGARLATSSIRRTAILHHIRPDLRIEPIRGNVPTRLRKAQALELDGVVLACAGLDRLGLAVAISERLAVETMLPEAGQGAIAVELRRADTDLREMLTVLHDPSTAACCAAERACVRQLAGSCRTPISAYAVRQAEQLWLRALVCSVDGTRSLWAEERGMLKAPEALGGAVADELLRAGAADLLG